MSEPQSPFAANHRPSRLAIIHLLGWMVGVGAILATFRATTNDLDYPKDWLPWLRVQQLGFGLAYGTAISGLGLFIWRWFRSKPGGPSQPGHWLLIFGGIGLIIDLAATHAMKLALLWSGTGIEFMHYSVWLFYQAIVRWMAAVIVTIILTRLRDASFWWIATTVAAMLTLTLDTSLTTISFFAFMHGAGGSWLWEVPLMVRIVGILVILPILWTAEFKDRARGVPRDWLHGGGIAAISGLALIDLASNVVSLSRW
jgi:hypothetical protein